MFLYLWTIISVSLQLALEDPVHSVSLQQFVYEKLKAQQMLMGDQGFQALMETVDTEIVRQLQEFLQGMWGLLTDRRCQPSDPQKSFHIFKHFVLLSRTHLFTTWDDADGQKRKDCKCKKAERRELFWCQVFVMRNGLYHWVLKALKGPGSVYTLPSYKRCNFCIYVHRMTAFSLPPRVVFPHFPQDQYIGTIRTCFFFMEDIFISWSQLNGCKNCMITHDNTIAANSPAPLLWGHKEAIKTKNISLMKQIYFITYSANVWVMILS